MGVDAEEIIQLATVGISALLQVVGKIKATSGMTDDQIMAAAQAANDAAGDAIKGYLAALPPA